MDDYMEFIGYRNMVVVNGLKGLIPGNDLAKALFANCGRCCNVACKGSNISEKKPYVIQVFAKNGPEWKTLIENDSALFFGALNEDTVGALKYIASLFQGGVPAFGELMLAIAYCDGKPSSEALNSIKAFYS